MTTQQLTQQEMLDLLQEDNARYQKIILHLNDEEQQTAFTPEGWSVKDFLSHTSHWKAATHKVLVAYIHDQPLPPAIPTGNEANAAAREIAKELSLPQVRNYWEEAHMHLTHLVADELDDKKRQEEVLPPWSESTPEPLWTQVASVCEHDAEHFELIDQYFELGKQA